MITIRGKIDLPPRTPPKPDPVPPPTALARRLALAHHVNSLVEDCTLLKDFAEAARKLGITKARLSQVMGLRLFCWARSPRSGS